MFGHPLELIVVLVLALIVFGPEKLPEVAATAGKFVRELRESVAAATNPEETTLPDDFSTYYYDSMAHDEGGGVAVEEMPDPADDGVDFSHTGQSVPSGSHPWDSADALDDPGDTLDPAAHATVMDPHSPVPDPHASDDLEYHP